MSDPDSKLTEALSADPPPARDPWFRLEVLMRIEKARFRRRFILTLLSAAVAAALVVVNAQSIQAWIANDIWHLALVAAGTIAVMLVDDHLLVGSKSGVTAIDPPCPPAP